MLDDKLPPIDYDQWNLLLHITSAPNKRRDKKVIYKKSLHLLFRNDMGKFITTDTRYMYLTEAGKSCLFEIAMGKRGIEFTDDQRKQAIKDGVLVRGNQGYQFRTWQRWNRKG
jgi:hypothetical protein